MKKSIITIDVADEKWQTFLKSFDAYKESVEGLPDDWKKLTEAMGGAGTTFSKAVTKAMGSLDVSVRHIADMAEGLKKASKGMDGFEKSTGIARSGMKGLLHDSGSLSKTLFGVGKFLLKFGSIGAMAGVFGMFGLAESGYKRERESRGLGMSTGEIKSFQTNMAPFAPQGVLQTAANVKNDISKWPWISAMGIPIDKALTESTRNLSFDLINHARSVWMHGPQTLQYAEARGLTQMGFGLDDLRRLANTPEAQLQSAEKASVRDADSMGISMKTLDAWTRLRVELDKAGVQIETVLIKGLAPLAPVFVGLARALTGDFVKFMDEPGTKKSIGNLGKTAETFVKFLGSEGLKKDIADFGSAIGKVTQGVLWLANELDKHSFGEKTRNVASFLLNTPPPVAAVELGNYLFKEAKKDSREFEKGMKMWWGDASYRPSTAKKSRPSVQRPTPIKITGQHGDPGANPFRSLNSLAP